jgi:glycine C-acetyltransferase
VTTQAGRTALEHYRATLAEIESAGLTKRERVITSEQGAAIDVQGRQGEVLNFCANNYLGLSSHPHVIASARASLESHGYGMSSVRFICGTQDWHLALEKEIAAFLGTDDAILYSSCFDANGGLFETVLGEQDAIISDELNHASIIDGVRLCKAQRFRYKHADMSDLRAQLQAAKGARIRMIATDGVFSMDGDVAPLQEICRLADEHDCLVMVDDSHASGFIGRTGRGTPEHCGVQSRVDVVTSTLGKALGGASGGFTTGRREIIDLLRQRSRPYLFSNSLAPMIVAASRAVIGLLSSTTELRDRLERNTMRFREGMTSAGFRITPGVTPIVPIMLGDARLASGMAADLLAEGIYVIGFSYPVVPQGKARIRVQLSAGHEPEHVEQAIEAFTKVGKARGVIG